MTSTTTAEMWSPTQVIALGYFDGPTEGVLKLSDGQVFRFTAVAEDNDRELRVFTLAALEAQLFDELVRVLGSALGPPIWPIWVPRWHFADTDLKRVTEQSIDAILEAAELSDIVLCSDNLERCLAIRSIDERQLSGVTSWFEFMKVEGGLI